MIFPNPAPGLEIALTNFVSIAITIWRGFLIAYKEYHHHSKKPLSKIYIFG